MQCNPVPITSGFLVVVLLHAVHRKHHSLNAGSPARSYGAARVIYGIYLVQEDDS